MQKALKIYDLPEERMAKCIEIAKELEIYKMKQGVFAYEMTWLSAVELSTAAWWAKYKAEVPTLSWFAQRITSQVVSSSASERGHKANRKVRAVVLLFDYYYQLFFFDIAQHACASSLSAYKVVFIYSYMWF